MKKLQFSIPANNQKIIELYNKMKKNELDPNPLYQRKLVWRKQHKIRFIETILFNYPFPEVYIAPGELDTETLSLTDQIVDGQQRLTTIANYIENKEIFSQSNLSIQRFSDLSREDKEHFLNYEVSVRYLKSVDNDQVKEIFQRINSTEYSLNKTERLNAQWGDSEFICFGKQVIETDLDIDTDIINFRILPGNRQKFLDFFHTKYSIFTSNDISRMLALQYILTLLATLCEGAYFRRNDKVQFYIESYFDEFPNGGELEIRLKDTVEFIDSLGIDPKSYWFNKANIFTLIVECYNFDVQSINSIVFKTKLNEFENIYRNYTLKEFDLVDDMIEPAVLVNPIKEFNTEEIRYFDSAREAVNDITSREFRGKMIKRFLIESLKDAVPDTQNSEQDPSDQMPGNEADS